MDGTIPLLYDRRMGLRSYADVTPAILLSLSLLLSGCDLVLGLGKYTETTGSGGTSSSNVSGTGMSSTGTGGSGPSACAAYMMKQCERMKTCAPDLFALHWEDDALCQAEAVRLCDPTLPTLDGATAGVQDPTACLAAISAGDCVQYLKTMDQPPTACLPKPGSKAAYQACIADSQCAKGLACFYGGPTACPQYCAPVSKSAGIVCSDNGRPQDHLCDTADGYRCVRDHGAPGGFGCRTVVYGSASAPCVPYSDQGCDSGLACRLSLPSICIPLLQKDAVCTPTSGIPGTGVSTDRDPCDSRIGLHCALVDPTKPANGYTCQPPPSVPDGMSCDGTTVLCEDYSYCDATTKKCKRRAMLGEACAASGCFPPYQCNAGVCSAPSATPPPQCSPSPPASSQLTCGPTPGGLLSTCQSGTVCCTNTPPTPGVDGEGSCVPEATCQATQMWSDLQCNDSSQCGSGLLCCLTPTGDFGTSAKCVAASSCKGLEVCRLGGPTVCTFGVCHPTSSWNGFITNDTGFCTIPTCKQPTVGCASNAECCSGSCDTADTGRCY